LGVGGHAWQRRFSYTAAGRYGELTGPGGAALLAAILGERAIPVAVPADAPTEHLRLTPAEPDGFGFAFAGPAGWSGGPGRPVEPRPAGESGATVIWDEGEDFGHPTVPASGPGRPAEETGATVIWDEGENFGRPTVPASGPVLWASNRRLPDEATAEALAGRALAVVDVAVLRAAGAVVRGQTSWEQAATDLVWQIGHNPQLRSLKRLAHVVVPFAEDGAVYLRRLDGEATAVLCLTHGDAEGTLRRRHGGLPDAWAVFVAQLACQVGDVVRGWSELNLYPCLAAAADLTVHGYDLDDLDGGYGTWLGDEADAADTRVEFAVPPPNPAEPAEWRIGSDDWPQRSWSVALALVKRGLEAVDRLPHLTVGALTAVDRPEIEAFAQARGLIARHLAADAAAPPLSLAVFGPPGSSRTFGLTALAEAEAPGRVAKLQFDVAQFRRPEDLTAAFHAIRDQAAAGRLPVAFFRGFDARRDGARWGWLARFLTPMAEGRFADEAGLHPLGRCVLVFVGGGAPTFAAFCRQLAAGDGRRAARARDARAEEFVSRLSAVVDVLGPNPTGPDDTTYIVRRALVLRALLERRFGPLTGDPPVSDDVLRAMLLVPSYTFGVRSMAAIAALSQIDGPAWETAALPFGPQLDLHVDAGAFTRLAFGRLRLAALTDELARAVHDDFYRQSLARGTTGPYVAPWDNLPEAVQEDNRRQVRLLGRKLHAIGCDFDAGDTPFPSVEAFTADEIEILARLEHDYWMAAKAANGYVYGPVRDDDPAPDAAGQPRPRTHPDMVPWEDLTEVARHKDRDTARNIITLLKSAGLRVYRMV
jgi:hypothetical protein